MDRKILDSFVAAFREKVIYRLQNEIDLAFITGSYVRKKQFDDEPNINIYLVSKEDNFYRANYLYGKLLSELIAAWSNETLEVFVDLHPYAFGKRNTTHMVKNRISITTNMFNGKDKENRLNLTQNIGNGWNTSFKLLYGNEEILRELKNEVTKSESWWLERKYALHLYKSQVQALPFIYPVKESPLILFRESLHYAEEGIRDGVSIQLDSESLATGGDLQIIHDWRNKLVPFYWENYNEKISSIVSKFSELKYSKFEEQCDLEKAEECYKWTVELLQELIKVCEFKYKNRKKVYSIE
ncbi:hypothetical protein PDJ99_26270 [Bacillus cereus]|nr:hypothetical protein [Bacillus cereus]